VVHFDGKDVLDYVLEFIGLPKAEYSNEVLFKCGLFRGEVIIQLPKVEEARCGGRTKFHGIDLFTAAEAEEDAAGKALRFLETKLKLVIVDKNYADRVEAKNNHVFRTRLLENFLGVAERIKKQWAHMNEYLNGAVHVFAGEGVLISADQVAARKFVFDGFVKVADDCNSRYEASCSKIKDMYKYYPKVAKLNN
jgi:hypothetical protein